MDWISEQLKERAAQHLLRTPGTYEESGAHICIDGKEYINLSSNDYLNLANHEALKQKATEYTNSFGTGATSSRLICGTQKSHIELEEKLASFKNYPASLVFGSGYLANIGIIPALAGKGDLIIADKLAHACMIDGAQLSGAKLLRFRHNDLSHLEALLQKSSDYRQTFILTESVFSMDGDLAPVKEIGELAKKAGANFIVDEAHATGIFGPSGAGVTSMEGVQDLVHIAMGTLSKALGGYGGFVSCSTDLRSYFINMARSFVYSTGLPPSAMGSSLAAIEWLEANPGAGQTLLAKAERFRQKLNAAGLDTGDSASQIIPVIIGDNKRTLDIADKLKAHGILAVAIRPPTVPQGTARLRCSISLGHSDEELDFVAEEIIKACN